MKKNSFKNFALLLLLYSLIVILWGAWVRISHSGDGCGDTWPLCHGQIIPEAQRGKTWVEFTHRLMSGLYGLIVIYFWWISKIIYTKGTVARTAALATLIFMITEALLGAKLVLFQLVGTNDTPFRAFAMALHQVNSFLLTGAIAWTYAAASEDQKLALKSSIPKKINLLPFIIVVLGITGAWAALSNSLFPSQNLWDGFLADLSQDSHFLIRLRGLHPLLALIGGGGLAIFFWVHSQAAETEMIHKRSLQMSLILVFAILFGMATLLLHAPTWMKVVHLALAHTVWVVILQWLYFMRSTHLIPSSDEGT